MAQRRVVVFGIFDGVHDGHRDLFRQAKELGDELVVIVGRNSIAVHLKGKKPKHSEQERIELLKKESFVEDVVLGDEELSSYKVLGKLSPDVVCFGYDQEKLEIDLHRWLQASGGGIELHRAKPYKEETHHSSLLTRKDN